MMVAMLLSSIVVISVGVLFSMFYTIWLRNSSANKKRKNRWTK